MSTSEKIDLKAVPLNLLSPEAAVMTVDGKLLHFRPVDISDWDWMGKMFGQKPEDVMEKGIPLQDMARILYRLLQEKDLFPATTVKEYDDDGEFSEERIPGPEMFMKALKGFDAIGEMARVFTECLGIAKMSDEERARIVAAAKKKLKRAK